jgi:hypothetical protein
LLIVDSDISSAFGCARVVSSTQLFSCHVLCVAHKHRAGQAASRFCVALVVGSTYLCVAHSSGLVQKLDVVQLSFDVRIWCHARCSYLICMHVSGIHVPCVMYRSRTMHFMNGCPEHLLCVVIILLAV